MLNNPKMLKEEVRQPKIYRFKLQAIIQGVSLYSAEQGKKTQRRQV